MDTNAYIKYFQQVQEKTSRQKDILDTWDEMNKNPFDRMKAINQAKKNKASYSQLVVEITAASVVGTRPWEELSDYDIYCNLQWQLEVLIGEEIRENPDLNANAVKIGRAHV